MAHLSFEIIAVENTVDGNYIDARILDRKAFFPCDPAEKYQFLGAPTFVMCGETRLGGIPVVDWVSGGPNELRPEERLECRFCSRDRADVTGLMVGSVVRLEPVTLLAI